MIRWSQKNQRAPGYRGNFNVWYEGTTSDGPHSSRAILSASFSSASFSPWFVSKFHRSLTHLTSGCLSFYIKTPYSIHAFSPDKLVENHPEGHILQFEFENERPTQKLIEETTNAIKNHENLSKNCVLGESLKSGIPPELSKVIPSHSCLIFSPSNIQKDGNVDELFKEMFQIKLIKLSVSQLFDGTLHVAS